MIPRQGSSNISPFILWCGTGTRAGQLQWKSELWSRPGGGVLETQISKSQRLCWEWGCTLIPAQLIWWATDSTSSVFSPNYSTVYSPKTKQSKDLEEQTLDLVFACTLGPWAWLYIYIYIYIYIYVYCNGWLAAPPWDFLVDIIKYWEGKGRSENRD